MDISSWVFFSIAVLVGIVYLRSAMTAGRREQERIERADDARERSPALPRYIVAGVGFGTACALLAHSLAPAAAYAILCLAMVARCVADQIAEEQAPRRRSAFLGRSRRIDPVLLAWIGLAALSSLFLMPQLLEGPDRGVAIVVAACVAAMTVVAWRIASAPPVLLGNDIDAEQVVDRETRAIRTGNTCVIAVGAVGLFTAWAGFSQNVSFDRLGYILVIIVWAGLFVWKSIYARHLSRTSLAS